MTKEEMVLSSIRPAVYWGFVLRSISQVVCRLDPVDVFSVVDDDLKSPSQTKKTTTRMLCYFPPDTA